jgi:hypothetical protein
MLDINYLVCMVHGPASSNITYKGSTYQYCLQRGKLELPIVNGYMLPGKEACL